MWRETALQAEGPWPHERWEPADKARLITVCTAAKKLPFRASSQEGLLVVFTERLIHTYRKTDARPAHCACHLSLFGPGRPSHALSHLASGRRLTPTIPIHRHVRFQLKLSATSASV